MTRRVLLSRSRTGAALVASVALVVPAFAATSASASPAASAPASAVRSGTDDGGFADSDTPGQTRTRARVAGSDPAAAARRFLADRRSTYHIDGGSLRTTSQLTENGVTTVRFAQGYRGLPVAGAQYVVRLEDQGNSSLVTGTSGQYFTSLDVDTSHPLAFRMAKAAALRAMSRTRWEKSPRVTDKGSAVVPIGKGVLTRHVVVRGYDVARHQPIRQQVYIHAHTGQPVLTFNDLQSDGPVNTNGPSVNGGTVPLKAYARASGGYELRDRSRPMYASDGGEIITRDAKGADVSLFTDAELPPRLQPAYSPTLPFPASAKAGANDAHWSLGQVYDYYRDLGRDSIDGSGGTLTAVVGVTDYGYPFPNAFWNGSYMVFGAGGYGLKPFGSALDVVGHELTHGVIEHTSDLMYLGQSGTVNEAAADYMGNTIQNKVEGISPSSPLDGLLGEQLCLKGKPASCAIRDMDTLATTDDFVSTPEDNGGVHENSTIVSGSWWQIRHELGAGIADPLVYKTITQYLTPLSQFIDAREATIAAAQDSGLTTGQVDAVRQAFTDHGIEDNWEQSKLGVDFHPLHTLLGNPFVYPRVADGTWVATDVTSLDDQYTSILTGNLSDSGPGTRLSPDEAAYFDTPDTDGTTVAWSRTRDTDGRTYIQSKDLSGGTITTEDFIGAPFLFSLRVSGQTIAYQAYGDTGDELTVLRPDGTARTIHPMRGRTLENADVLGSQVVYAVIKANQKWIRIRSYDSVTRTNKILATLTSKKQMVFADLTITPNHVVYSLDRTIRTAGTGIFVMDRDGKHRRTLIGEGSRSAPAFPMLTATDDAVSFTDTDVDSFAGNAYLRQIPLAGGAITQVSCSRGYKGAPASDTGTGVTWVDFTTGMSQIVNRTTPVGACG